MKSSFLGALVFVLGLMLIASPSAFAGGTKEGTVITNTATLTYYAGGGGSQLQVTDDAIVTVQKVESVTVTENVAPSTLLVGDGTNMDLSITVTNTGNGTDSYDLTYTEPTGLTFVGFYVDANGNGVLDAGETTPVISVGPLDGWTYESNGTPATEESVDLIARYTIDQDLPSGSTLIPTVTATDDDNGTSSDLYTSGTYTIERAVLTTATKVVDFTTVPYGREAGDVVQYTITLTAGNGANEIDATNVTLTDVYPAQFSSVANISTLNGTASETPAGTVTWNVGTIAAGATATLTFEATIDAGVSAGTDIDNFANLAYDDANINSVWTRSATTNTETFTTIGYAISLTLDNEGGTTFATNSASANVEPNNVVRYRLKLTNDGTVADDISFTDTTSSDLWPWTIYVDGDENGTFDSGVDDTPANLATNISLAAGASAYFWAVGTPNANTVDQAVDVMTYTFTSVGNGSQTATGSHTTTVNAPNIVLLKFASTTGDMVNSTTVDSPVANVIPGQTFYYVIRYDNIGAADASTVIIADPIPTNLTNAGGTVEFSATGLSGSWSATVPGYIDTVTDNASTVTLDMSTSGLTAGTEGYVRFQVTVN